MVINLFGKAVDEPVEAEAEKANKPPSPFDWINNITYKKNDMREQYPQLKGFEPFIINKGLGQNQAAVGIANLMNRMAHLPKETQYIFYLHGLPKCSLRAKWAKSDMSKEFKEFTKRTGLSEQKAKDAWEILSPDQIDRMLNPVGGAGKRGRIKK